MIHADRYTEIQKNGNDPDQYEFTVIFQRYLSDDLNCGGEPLSEDLPVGQAL